MTGGGITLTWKDDRVRDDSHLEGWEGKEVPGGGLVIDGVALVVALVVAGVVPLVDPVSGVGRLVGSLVGVELRQGRAHRQQGQQDQPGIW